MTPTSLVLALLTSQASPAPDLCRWSAFTLTVNSTVTPAEQSELDRQGVVIREDGVLETTAVVYEGQVVDVTLSGSLFSPNHAASPVTAIVRVNGATTDEVAQEWKRGASGSRGTSFVSEVALKWPPRPAGVYELSAVLPGCGQRHHQKLLKLVVRPVQTNDDRAAVRMPVAQKLAWETDDCSSAMSEVVAIEKLSTKFVIPTLRIRGLCEERSGRLAEALKIYAKLEPLEALACRGSRNDHCGSETILRASALRRRLGPSNQ